MSITIDCSVSLSKKLRPLADEHGSLTLVVHDIVNGKGVGKLSIASDKPVSLDIHEMGETAIMIEPVAVAEEVPANVDSGVGSIFSTVAAMAPQEDSPVARLAVTEPPETKKEISTAVKKVETPAQFKEMDDKDCAKFVSNLNELADAISAARGKAPIELNLDGLNERQAAVRMEEAERAQGIDVPAWIVNDQAATLSINDMGISLPLNAPYDLSNISAKRIAESSDLKSMLRAGFIKFISPEDIGKYVSKANEAEASVPMLDVFDSADQAFGNMAVPGQAAPSTQPIIDESNMMEVGEEEARAPTEEEALINLTGIQQTRSGVRTSTHGHVSQGSQRYGSAEGEGPKGVVSVARKV